MIIVTGAKNRYWCAVAQHFSKEGAQVMILDRTEEILQETARENDQTCYFFTDIEEDNAIAEALEMTLKKFGKLDVWME